MSSKRLALPLLVLVACRAHAPVTAPPPHAAAPACAPFVAAATAAPPRAHQVLQRQDAKGLKLGALVPLAGARLATHGNDGTTRIWDLASRTLLRVDRHGWGEPGPGGASLVVGPRGSETGAGTIVDLETGDARPWTGIGDARASHYPRGGSIDGPGPIRWVDTGFDDAFDWYDDAVVKRGTVHLPGLGYGADAGLEGASLSLVAGLLLQNGKGAVGEYEDSEKERYVLWTWPVQDGEVTARRLELDHSVGQLLAIGPDGLTLLFARFDGSSTDFPVMRLLRQGDANDASYRIVRGLSGGGAEWLGAHDSTFHALPHAVLSRDASRVAVCVGGGLAVYDAAKVFAGPTKEEEEGSAVAAPLDPLWTADSESRVLSADASTEGSVNALFQECAFSTDGAWVAVRTDDDVFVYSAATGRYAGVLGAKPRAPTAAPAFIGDRKVALASLDHVAVWNVANGDLAAFDPPPYFDRPERSSLMASGMCWPLYQDHFFALGGDVVRMRFTRTVSSEDINNPCYDGTWYDTCGDSDHATVIVERMDGAKALPALEKLEELPKLAAWPPPRGRSYACVDGWPGVGDVREASLTTASALRGFVPARGVLLTRNRETGATGVVDLAKQDAPRWLPREAEDAALAAGARLVVAKAGAWDAATGAVVYAAAKGEAVLGASEDGATLIVARGEKLAWIERATRATRGEQALPACPVHALRPGTTDVVCGDDDGRLTVIAPAGGARSGASDGGSLLQIAVSPDGARAATVSQDGALRVWDLARAELLATMVEFDDGEPLVYTPGGAYAGSGEAASRVAWTFDAPLEAFRFEQFASTFHRPDLVARRLGGEAVDAPQAVERPPRVTFAAAPEVARGERAARLRVVVDSPTRVDTVEVVAEGRVVGSAAVCAAHAEATLEAPLFAGENVLSAVAVDEGGRASNEARAEARSDASDVRPDLWVVAVGVSRYPHLEAQWQLEVADDDARAVAAAMRAQVGPGKTYAALHETVLVDDAATVDSVRAAAAGLAAMKPTDVAVVFFAGHGIKPSDEADMVFVTGSVAALDRASVLRASIGWTELGAALASARGRVVVLLDACHSGHVTQDVVVPNGAMAEALGEGGRAGVVVFSASRGKQVSYEGGTSRGLVLDARGEAAVGRSSSHGYFTGALLNALESPATDKNGDGVVQLSELVDDVTVRVTRTSQGKQTPWVARREMFGDFGLVKLK